MEMKLRLNLTNENIANLTNLLSHLVKENQKNNEAGDGIWILTSAFIIFTMQSGFGLLEAGKYISLLSHLCCFLCLFQVYDDAARVH